MADPGDTLGNAEEEEESPMFFVFSFSECSDGVLHQRLAGGHAGGDRAHPLPAASWETCVEVVGGTAGETDRGVPAVSC